MTFRIERYDSSQGKMWDEFVRASKNGTFLFVRDYMDYHADRFPDYSFIVWGDDAVQALLPASRVEATLVSHSGLTYGGLVFGQDMSLEIVLELFPILRSELVRLGLETLIYKTIPHIYHSSPAEEDRYCLFRSKAILYRSDVLTVIDNSKPTDFDARRTRSVKKARQIGLVVRPTEDYAAFWDILAANLNRRYGLQPVHSLPEIQLLASRFPGAIQLHAVYEDQTMLAGAVLYLTDRVCHVQYNAANERGKQLGAQDLLFADLIQRFRSSHRYFDFGVSTEKEGTYLNTGLAGYKEGFGGRCVVHDFFRLDLSQSIE